MVCHYWFFNDGFKFCKFCLQWLPWFDNTVSSDVAIITVKSVKTVKNYCCIIYDISNSEAIYLLDNPVLHVCHYI